jgi:HAD superfamily hydrolase (TIGR01509 family)
LDPGRATFGLRSSVGLAKMRAMPSAPRSVAALVEHDFEPLERDYGGYIFDCDGTIADSMPLHFRAWRTAFAAHGAPFEFGWELFLSRAGKTLEVTVEELNAQFSTQLDPDAIARTQRETYGALLPDVGPVQPVVEFLRSVAGRRPMAVASGGDLPTVRSTLHTLGVLDLFPVIVTAFDVKHGKPAPDLFLLAAERIAVPASECVVFEDSVLGIEAAERAGMAAVLVRRLLPPPLDA